MLYPKDDVVEQHIKTELDRLQGENTSISGWIRAGKDAPKCVVCGEPIENVSIQRRTRPFLWCSRDCFITKPRKIIYLEQEYGLDIVDILKETTRRYGNIKAQCEALRISIPYFYDIVVKYCGDDYIAFMARYSTGKRKETYVNKLKNRQV